MAKTSAAVTFQCGECGWTAPKWVGRCGECQAWGTVAELGAASTAPKTTASRVSARELAVPIASVPAVGACAIAIGLGEVDRVLGGGVVPGSVMLLAGEPGIGKSTLLLEVAAAFSASLPRYDVAAPAVASRKVLYLTGEESAAQVRSRALRIGALSDELYLAAETDLGRVLGQIEAVEPALVIVDSVQTIASGQVEGSAGGIAQVREVASALIASAKGRNLPMVLVGHVTKDGSVAGPRTLEHLVDVVLQFEGGDPGLVPSSHSTLRLLRANKNRFGPTDEVGCFELSETGLAGLPDPSGLFLTERARLAAGTGVTVTLEGRRPLAVEIQALVAPAHGGGNPRRATSGVESARLAMLLAVLARHAKLPLLDREVYLATVGGVRLAGPSGDLAAALAIASSCGNIPLPPGLVAIGEVGLAGDIRSVPGLARRLSEAERLGFTHALVAHGSTAALPESSRKLKLLEVKDIAEAVNLALVPKTAQPAEILRSADFVLAAE